MTYFAFFEAQYLYTIYYMFIILKKNELSVLCIMKICKLCKILSTSTTTI